MTKTSLLKSSGRDLSGKVVLVTGAGSGIGAETARQLVGKGALVALVDRDELAATRLADELGDNAAAFTADVADSSSTDAAVRAVVARFGGIDAVVANAGISGSATNVVDVDPVDFERVIQINLLGVFRTVKAALPHVIERGGYVLMTASIMSTVPGPTIASYAASKAGVEAFGRSLRIELAKTGVRVGIAYFGVIDTNLVASNTASAGISDLLAAMPGSLSKKAPVSSAGAVMVAGIERRSRRVYAPGYVPFLLDLRTIFALIDPLLPRVPGIARAIQAAETRYQSTKASEAGKSRAKVSS